MAATLGALAGAPVEVKVGGVVFKMSPLRLREHAEYERWAQGRLCELAATAAGKDTAKLTALIGSMSHLGFHSPEVQNLIYTEEGAARLLWMGIRRNDPKVTLETILDTISTQEIIDNVKAFEQVNYPETNAPKAEPPATTPAS